MNYSAIIKDNLIDGEGVRCAVYVSGCSKMCEGCYNPETWKYTAGTEYTPEVHELVMQYCNPDYCSGLSLLGGDPLELKNISAVLDICKDFKLRYPDKTIWCWTGYTLQEVQNNHAQGVLEYIDVLVDGRYEQEKRDLSLQFRGSSNQRILRKGTDF